MTDIPAGIFRHYKGPLYLVLGLAHDANSDEWAGVFTEIDPRNTLSHHVERPYFPDGRTVVIYIALQLDGAHLGPRLAVRTLEDFVASVCGTKECPRYGEEIDEDPYGGCIRCKEAPVFRFTYLGPELTKEMTA